MKTKRNLARALFAACAGLAPGLALAQISPFTPPDGDMMMRMLEAVFGGVFSPDGFSDPGPFGALLGVISGAALLIGGAMAAYQMIAGTMQTAHDGELLGKRWSSMWMPVRLALGTALAIPAVGGLCAAHLLVAWLVTQGVGLANEGWKAYAERQLTPGAAWSSMPAPQVDAMAYGMLKSATCVLMLREMSRDSDKAHIFPTAITAGASGSFASGATRKYGVSDNPDLCGSVSMPSRFAHSERAGDYLGGSGGMTALSAGAALAEDARIAREIAAAHARQSQVLESRMIALAAEVQAVSKAGGKGKEAALLRAKFAEATREYKSEVSKAGMNAMRSPEYWQRQKENAVSDGFAGAGVWGVRLAQVGNAAAGSVADSPRWNEVRGMSEFLGGEFDAHTGILESFIPKHVGIPKTGASKQVKLDEEARWETPDASEDLSWGDRVAQWTEEKLKKLSPEQLIEDIISKVTITITGEVRDVIAGGVKDASEADFASARNPLVTGTEMGHQMIAVGASATLIYGIVVIVMPGGLALDAAVGGLIKSAILVLMGGGAAMASLAWIPFVLWGTALLGFMVLVGEALIAAPLWAISHIHGHGDGVASESRQGYQLLLALTLRPVLMVAGLALATMLLPVIARWFDVFFLEVISLGAGNSMTGLVVCAAAVALLVTTKLSLVFFCYRAIHFVPDQVLRWLGGGGSSGMIGSAAETAGGGRASAATAGAIVAKAGMLGADGMKGGAEKIAKLASSKKAAVEDRKEKEPPKSE